jgi:hypothetical protein
MAQSDSYTPYKKQMRIRKSAPEGVRGNTPYEEEREFVRRVLWRRNRIIVYQHVDGRYLRADLNAHRQGPAVIRGTHA